MVAPAPMPTSLMRIHRQAYRDWLNSGNAADITINNISNQAASAALGMAGTITLADAQSVPMPSGVSVNVVHSGSTVAVAGTVAVVSPTSATWGASVPGATLPAATGYTATVNLALPPDSAVSNSFTLT